MKTSWGSFCVNFSAEATSTRASTGTSFTARETVLGGPAMETSCDTDLRDRGEGLARWRHGAVAPKVKEESTGRQIYQCKNKKC